MKGGSVMEKKRQFTQKQKLDILVSVKDFCSRSFSCRVVFHRRPLSGDKKNSPPRSLRLE
jgi:hypothetical protein